MPLTSFCHPVAKGLYISSGDLMDCRSIHVCYLPNGLLLSASLYSVSFRRALHSSSSGVTSGGMSPSMTWIFFCKIKLFHSFMSIVNCGTSHRVRVCLRKVEKQNWCSRGHTMHQTCLLELLRPLVIVLSITSCWMLILHINQE